MYQNNDVTLKYTNPSYSNLSIPYLVLYDADKLINVDVTNKAITYKKSSIDVATLYDRVKCSYYGSKHSVQKELIKTVVMGGDKKYKLDGNKIKFKERDLSSQIRLMNESVLLPNNFMLNSTTIEGSLININNIYLFNKWLVAEVINNVSVKQHNNVNKFISVYKGMSTRGVNISKIFNGLLCLDGVGVNITSKQERFVKFVKYKYLNEIKKELNKRCNDIEELLILYRLVFGGKTDTLISCSNASFNKHVDISYRKTVMDTKKKYLLVLDPIMGKTGGWVTRFIDFSIEYIESNCKDGDITEEFKYYFPEIYDIVSVASSSIE